MIPDPDMPDEPTRLAYVILWEGAPREGTLVNRIHETVHLLSLREEHHPYLVKAHLLAYEILINHPRAGSEARHVW